MSILLITYQYKLRCQRGLQNAAILATRSDGIKRLRHLPYPLASFFCKAPLGSRHIISRVPWIAAALFQPRSSRMFGRKSFGNGVRDQDFVLRQVGLFLAV